jgi:O-antigen/teichoic acid export membrane protein
MFTNLQLRAVQATDANRDYIFGDYFALRLLTTGLGFLVILGIALLGDYRSEAAWVIIAVGAAKAVEATSDVFYGLLQQRERMDRIAFSMILKGILSLTLFSLLTYLTQQVIWGVIGLIGAWVLVLNYDVRNGAWVLKKSEAVIDPAATRPLPRWQWRALFELVRLSLPLGLVMMLISLNTNIPRYFVERYWGEAELGIFSAMAYIIVAGNTLVISLGHAASPRLAKYYAQGNARAFTSLLARLAGIGGLLGIGGVLIAALGGEWLLTLIYGPEYATRIDVFTWIMIAAGVQYLSTFVGVGMTAARYFRAQLPLFIAVVLVTTAACFWLIPSHGLIGAAYALVLGASVQALGGLGIILTAISRIRPAADT